MYTFMLLVTVWNPFFNQYEITVLDTRMTGEDCIAAMIDKEPMASVSGSVLSCEFDYFVKH